MTATEQNPATAQADDSVSAKPLGGHGKDNFIQTWRGIAALLVIYYHFTDRVPYQAFGAANSPLLPFYSGKIGVLIFFIISGFLIAASIRGCTSLGSFYAKRISRIWPLFILAATVTFIFLQFVDPPVVEDGPKRFATEHRTISDLFGTIFFLYDFGFDWIDGVYWSILVELKFYLWIGILAWLSPGNFTRWFASASFLFALAEIMLSLSGTTAGASGARLLNGVVVAQYLPFFAIGVLLYDGRSRELLTLNIFLALSMAGLKIAANPNFEMAGTIRFVLALTFLLAFDAFVLRSWIFGKLGDYSYSWYLFHQMIGLSLVRMMAPTVQLDLAIAAALAFTLAIAVAASLLVEWRCRRFFYDVLMRVFAMLRLDRLPVTRPVTTTPDQAR